jgi:GDP-L-fucose synthase
MMMKFDMAVRARAPHVFLWGSGKPLREFLHVDDLAAALLVMAECYDDLAPVNVGSGDELSIAALAHVLKKITGFEGSIVFDASRPDGVPRKLLDSSKMRGLGWAPSVSLEEGLRDMYGWYRGRETARKTA